MVYLITYKLLLIDISKTKYNIYYFSSGSATSSAAVSVVEDKQKGQAPQFSKGLEDTQAEFGSLIKLTVKASGVPEPKIKFLHNGEVITPLPGYIRISEYPDGTHTLVMNDVSAKTAGEYKAIASNDFGSVESTGTVSVVAKPDIIKGLKDAEVEENTPICWSCKFEAFPEPTLKWTHDGETIIPDGISIIATQLPDGTATLTIKEAKLSDAGDYRLEIQNEAGKINTHAHLSVTPKIEEEHGEPPVFIVPLEDTQVHLGSVAKFEIEVASKDATLKWTHKNKPVVPQRGVLRITENPDGTSVLLINAAKPEDAGEYAVTATNKYGSCSSKAILSVVAKPSITSDLKDLEVQQNAKLELEVKFEGTPAPNVKFTHNGKEITPETATIKVGDGVASLVIDEAAIEDGGEYRAILTNDFGSATSTAFISVLSDKTEDMPVFVNGLYNRSIEIGKPIEWQIKVSGEPKPVLKWLHNGEELETIPNEISIQEDQDGNYKFSIASVSTNDAGEYRVIATNPHGTSTSNAILTVLSKPTILDGLKDCDIVEGSPIVLKARIKGYPSPNVKWYLNGNEIIPDDRFVKVSQGPDGLHTLEIPKAAISDSGEYSVQARNELGAVQSKALISVSTKSNIILQHGEKPEFEEGLEDAEVDIGSTLEFDVVVSGVPQPSLKFLHNGKEVVPEEGHIKITNNPDGSTTLSILEATLEDAGDYRALATNPNGTAVSDGSLSVLSKPVVVSELKDKYLIEGETAKFEVKVIGFPKVKVQWLFNEEAIQPNQNISIEELPDNRYILTIDKVSADDIGRYSVVATNKCGKSSSDARLYVSPKIVDGLARAEKPEFVKELTDLHVDEGFPAKFEVKVTGNPDELKWYRNGEPVQTQSGVARISTNPDGNAYLILHEVSPSDAGAYKVIASKSGFDDVESCCKLSVSSRPEDQSYDKLVAAQKDTDTPGIVLTSDLNVSGVAKLGLWLRDFDLYKRNNLRR